MLGYSHMPKSETARSVGHNVTRDKAK